MKTWHELSLRNESRCPLRDRIIWFMAFSVLIFNIVTCTPIMAVEEPIEDIQPKQIATTVASEPDTAPVLEIEPVLKSNEEILSEINLGLWGNGEERKSRLTEAGYDYDEIQSIVNNKYPTIPTVAHAYKGGRLTKRSGIYWNPNTGLKETWYSQKVLPGGGLNIHGRHVNNEGFVCDGDGYICVASSTYPKGTIIETSRGMGKVYDSGCAPGVLDIYVNW